LYDYYQREYPQSRGELHSVEADYDEGKNAGHATRILETYRSLMGRMPRSSFELGCAFGGMVATMTDRGLESMGSDIDESAIGEGTVVKSNRRIFHARNLDALASLKTKVDLIYSLHALEHDPELFSVVKACRAKLNDDGLLFISVPNAMFAGSILGGFKNNFWMNYPQHLHMLSPGFVQSLCRQTGFAPLLWDTRILFEVQPNVLDSFDGRQMTRTLRDLWSQLLVAGGFGMELNFSLTPDTPSGITRFATKAREVSSTLERARQQEVIIRKYLKTAAR
jgi:SAM-dependent methyltransferase